MAAGVAVGIKTEFETFHIAQISGARSTEFKTVHITQSPNFERSSLATFQESQHQEQVPSKNLTDIQPSSEAQGTVTSDLGSFNSSLKESESDVAFVHSASQIQKEPAVERIVRAHFVETVLSDLRNIQTHSGEPIAAVYASNLFRVVRQFREQSPFEPYIDILMALYDAMAFENRWAEYTGSQYEAAYKVLKSYANQQLDDSKTGKAILKLERLGFAVIPFDINSEVFEANGEGNEENGVQED